MEKIKKAVRLMNIIRIIAVLLVILAAILYFYAREYAVYPAIVGFVLIALINLPLNIWLNMQRNKINKKEEK
jgi:membrane protein YdbS with pleckstrin-like domain